MSRYEMKLHHIGIAVKNIGATAKLLSAFGYSAGLVEKDSVQRVNICFMQKNRGGVPLELVECIDTDSPVAGIINRNGTSVYHLCFEVNDIDEMVQSMRDEGYVPLGVKTHSVMNGRYVIFLFHPDNCLIELVETKYETKSL